MAKNSIAIVGKNRMAGEFLALSRERSVDATLWSETASLEPATNCVIDTESGDADRKRALLQRLDSALPRSSLIVTSCLRFGTTRMASWLKNPERLVGFATFFPLKDRKLIELAGGLRTGENFLAQAEDLFKFLGKETVRVKDTAGLTFPRVLSLIIKIGRAHV